MKPRRKEGIKWFPELAYVVGLIATDGSLSIDRRHIVFVSKDIQLIKTFKKILRLKNRICLKKNGYTKEKNCYHIQFGDVILYRWLLSIGLTPNKTKTIGRLKIPNKYFFDFLRGCFDGDGSCYSYWDKRWSSSFMFYITFTAQSLSHLQWIQAQLKKFSKINGYIGKSTRTWQLKYAKKESKILIRNLYHRENLPCLKRKYKKLKNILKIDNKEVKRKLRGG